MWDKLSMPIQSLCVVYSLSQKTLPCICQLLASHKTEKKKNTNLIIIKVNHANKLFKIIKQS